MSLDRHTLEVLDFHRIREVLAGFCATDLGKEQALALMPKESRSAVESELDALEELLGLDNEPELAGITDIRPLLEQARIGAVFTGPELERVRRVCTGVRLCHEFLERNRSRLVRLREMAPELALDQGLESEIEWAIDEAGAVRDAATPRLQELRNEIRWRRNRLVERLERMVEANPGWFEGQVMVRQERFVVPLRLEERGRVRGVVHAFSGTGQTLFVEPLETIGEQNELQELRDAEAEEVAGVLRRLSALVAAEEPRLRRALATVARLDLLVAKRRFSLRFDCIRPVISNDGRFEVVRARHPLLALRKSQVVPLDFRFPDDTTVVLISGPNAGGKTVVLKTLGLLSLMVGSGMFVPAAAGTRLPLFDGVFADIGDEQSLDADLSSFTAHLVRLKGILEQANGNSLVLIDEIGASTAPEEGAALAMAVMEFLRDQRVRCVATTHFGSLKVFVQDEPGMANAAMEFRNGPTYRLVMGIPGESSAFATAEDVGLPQKLLERARARLNKEWVEFTQKVRELEEELARTKETRRLAAAAQQEAERLRQEFDKRLVSFEEWARAERTRLKDEAERFLKETRREIENLVRSIRERNADHESVVRAKRFVSERLAEVTRPEPSPEVATSVVESLTPGDLVESRTFRRQGEVVEIEGATVKVAFGRVNVQIDRSDLALVKPAGLRQRPTPVVTEEFRFEPRLNVRGMTQAEAEEAVRRFLDDARIAGVNELSILHGKGSGRLRQMLWTRLRRDKRVERIRFAEPAQGGMGVTLVTLRSEG